MQTLSNLDNINSNTNFKSFSGNKATNFGDWMNVKSAGDDYEKEREEDLMRKYGNSTMANDTETSSTITRYRRNLATNEVIFILI